MTLEISKIHIQRFKNLDDVEISLSPTNVLIGANNAGKSSILQAIQFIISAAQCVGEDGLIQNKGENRGAATIAPSDLYYSPVDEVACLSRGTSLSQNWDNCIQLTFQLAHENSTFFVQIAKGKNGNLSIRTDGCQHWQTLASLAQPFSMYVPGLAGIATNEQYATPGMVRKAAARGHGNSVLRNVLWHLKRDNERWNLFEQHLSIVFPCHKIELAHDPESEGLVYANILDNKSNLPLGLAGTGLLQTIQILAYVNLYSPSLLLLDEPDSHIHPDKQQALLSVVTDWAASKGAKVLIATHSRHLLNSMEGNAIFHWMQSGKRQSDDDFDRVKVLMDLGALDRMDLLKNGGITGVVLTEDATAGDSHKNKDQNPLRKLLKANGVDLNLIQIWAYEGCTKVGTAKVLAAFINEHAPGAKILVHRDRDYLSDDEAEDFKKGFSSTSIQVFLTEGTDVESHYINKKHIASTVGISLEEASEVLDEAIQENESLSMDTFSRAEIKRQKALRHTSGQSGDPSPHAISIQCKEEFSSRPMRYSHGKKTLGSIRRLLQEKFGKNTSLLGESEHLGIAELKEFANKTNKSNAR